MKKSELIKLLEKEIQTGYIDFKKYDSVIIADFPTQWQQAVNLFYEKNKYSPLTENQKYFNIHCIFLEILKNEK